MTKYNLSKLHIFHPFKEINFVTSSYCSFYITNIHKIAPYYPLIKQRHLNLYYELFYNFGWFDRKSIHKKFCKICYIRHSNSTAQHVLCDCNSLNYLRQQYWINAHNKLVTIYNKIDTVHQKLYGFHVLQTLENIKKKIHLALLCGMNNNTKKNVSIIIHKLNLV